MQKEESNVHKMFNNGGQAHDNIITWLVGLSWALDDRDIRLVGHGKINARMIHHEAMPWVQ